MQNLQTVRNELYNCQSNIKPLKKITRYIYLLKRKFQGTYAQAAIGTLLYSCTAVTFTHSINDDDCFRGRSIVLLRIFCR